MNKNFVLLLLSILFISQMSLAQNNKKIDSLEICIKSQKKDTNYIKSVIKLVTFIRNSDINRAEKLISEALDLSEKLNYKTGVALSKLNHGTILHIKGDYTNAEKIYLEAINLFKQLKREKETAKCYNNLGNLYQLKSDYEKSLKYLLESEKISEKIGDKKGISDAELNIGNVYMQKRDYLFAIEHYNKCLNQTKKNKDLISQSQVLNNLGATYRLLNKLDTALMFYLNSLVIRKQLNDKVGTAENLLNIGDVYFHKQLSDSAIKYFKNAYFIYKELNHKLGLAYCNNNLGSILYSKKLYKPALDSLISSSLISKEIGALDLLAETDKNIAEIYFKIGNYKQSAIYQAEYSKLRDTILNEQNQKQIAEMQTKYDTEKKENDISLLKKDKLLQQTEMKKQQIIRNTFIAGFILVFILVLVVLRSYFQKKKANILLAEQKLEIELKNQTLNQQNEEIRTQRDEITIQKEHIEEQKQEITDSITYAKRIQQAVLPNLVEILSHKFQIPNTTLPTGRQEIQGGLKLEAWSLEFEAFILFKPKDIVSGDFYWSTRIGEMLIITVADCTGHGVPGAFMSMLGISFLNEIVRKKEITKASEVLDELRTSVIDALKQKGESGEQKDGMDIAFCAINMNTCEMQFAGANNPCWIVKSEKLKVESEKDGNENNFINFTNFQLYELKGDKMPIGIHANMQPFTNQKYQLKKGDIIYLMSDGYEDQFGGPNRKKFLSKNLKNLLTAKSDAMSLSNCQNLMADQKQILETTITDWIGTGEQIDDITILGLKI